MLQRRSKAARAILPEKWDQACESATMFAPVNIALVKYWGKRDEELHLPVTDSFSISLSLGTTTQISRSGSQDEFFLNGERIDKETSFSKKLTEFLDLVRPFPSFTFFIDTKNTVPTAAGLASSASGFAALVLSLNNFFGWNLSTKSLSILARLGSGSACRSVQNGFMHWYKGILEDGSDSFAKAFEGSWEDLCLGILFVDTKTKEISSRIAMKRTQETSPFYQAWPATVEKNLAETLEGINSHNFQKFGQAVEQNALAMHATMLTSSPAISFFKEGTVSVMHAIWQARSEGLSLYFTMDAGPNVKLLFLEKDRQVIQKKFPNISIVPLL
jgi:diphosphomevalonate decarboxylase